MVEDVDLERFFDRVDHNTLIDRLGNRIADRSVIRLIRAYLDAGTLINGEVEKSRCGAPQGGPLSPLLTNVLLDEVDRELERRGHCFVRYADDANAYVRSLSPAMSQFLESGKHPFGYRCVGEMQALWEMVFTRPPKVPAFLARALANKGAQRYEKIGKILGDFKDAGLYPLQPRLADVQAKTLVVWGSNDRVFDVSCLYEVRRLLPQASICIIEDAGHVPYLEYAEQTLQAIQRFLAGAQALPDPV